MVSLRPVRLVNTVLISTFSIFSLLFFAPIPQADALTIAIGQPYRGRLINGIPFPRQFRGYQLCSPTYRTYATPELIGGLLDALDNVLEKYPNTCDVVIRDFSKRGGGRLRGHKSHQNGRDVDIGMYAKHNRKLNGLIPMNSANLDVAKTWYLILSLIKTQRVQYIFLDRRLQRLFYRYAYSHGWNKDFLDHLFKNVGPRYQSSIIRHVPGHKTHLHVRFYAPWSCLAAVIPKKDRRRLAAIAMAQEAYLPKKVKYYVKGNEGGLRSLAQSFGVSYYDLCRWNNLRGSEKLKNGSCLVFFKRGFEVEPVTLAQALQTPIPRRSDLIRLASLQNTHLVDADFLNNNITKTRVRYYRVKSGDSLWSIAKRHHLTVNTLCKLNGISKKAILRPGKKLIVGRTIIRSPSSSWSRTITYYRVKQGDTLWSIAKQYRMTLDALCRLNGITPKTVLRTGKKLRVRARSKISGYDNTRKKRAMTSGKVLHTVRAGESLWQIAKQYGTSVNTLCALNGITPKTILRPGQKLKVPANINVRSAVPKSRAYTIKPGDSLWIISRKYRVSIDSLCRANSISSSTILRPGTQINIP